MSFGPKSLFCLSISHIDPGCFLPTAEGICPQKEFGALIYYFCANCTMENILFLQTLFDASNIFILWKKQSLGIDVEYRGKEPIFISDIKIKL